MVIWDKKAEENENLKNFALITQAERKSKMRQD
jgi:hypothetical protein